MNRVSTSSNTEGQPNGSDEIRRWLNRALRYLARYPVTRWELLRWFHRKKCPPHVARKVVRICRKRHYLDDREALRARFRQAFRKGWSRRRLEFELRRRGIPRTVAERAIRRWYPEEREKHVLMRRVKRTHRRYETDDREPFIRRYCQAGFPFQIVLMVWEAIHHEQPGDS